MPHGLWCCGSSSYFQPPASSKHTGGGCLSETPGASQLASTPAGKSSVLPNGVPLLPHPSTPPWQLFWCATPHAGVPQQRGVCSALAWPGFHRAGGGSQSRPPKRDRGAGESPDGCMCGRTAYRAPTSKAVARGMYVGCFRSRRWWTTCALLFRFQLLASLSPTLRLYVMAWRFRMDQARLAQLQS